MWAKILTLAHTSQFHLLQFIQSFNSSFTETVILPHANMNRQVGPCHLYQWPMSNYVGHSCQFETSYPWKMHYPVALREDVYFSRLIMPQSNSFLHLCYILAVRSVNSLQASRNKCHMGARQDISHKLARVHTWGWWTGTYQMNTKKCEKITHVQSTFNFNCGSASVILYFPGNSLHTPI